MDLMKRIRGTKTQKPNTSTSTGTQSQNHHRTHHNSHQSTSAGLSSPSAAPGSEVPGSSHVHSSKSTVTTTNAVQTLHPSLSNGNLQHKSVAATITANLKNTINPSTSSSVSGNRSSLRRRPRGTWIERYSEELPAIWRNSELCDAILISSNGTKHPVHRILLVSFCPSFRTLLQSQAATLNGKPMYNVDMDSSTLEQVLEFVYSANCSVDEVNVRKLLPVAHQLNLIGLTQLCFIFLKSQLTPENCLDIYKFTRPFCCQKLRSEMKSFILHNFKFVLRHFDYLGLEYEDFEELIKDDMLNIRNEEMVFDAIKKWIEHKPATRTENFLNLLHCVRWGLMSYRYFTTSVLPWKYIANNQAAQDALFDAQMFLAAVESRNGTDIDLNDPLARPRVPYEIIFAIGGWSAGSPTSFMETYDARADRWFLTPGTEVSPRAYHGLVALGQLIYMVGGFDGNDHFNTVRCYNPLTRMWTEKANMHFPRCYISCCALDGFIYAIGGFNGRSRMNSVERYDPATNQWDLVANMNRQRSDASACSHKGKVYVAGGFNGQEVLNSVEVYSPGDDQWTFILPMRSPRSGVSITVYNDHLYAIGGFNGFNRLPTVEKFDPQNPVHEWVPVAEMSSARSNFAAAVIDDMIFVIGGFNGTTTIPYVECYDGTLNEWFDAAHMNLNRSALAACVLRGLPNAPEYSYLSRVQETLGLDNELNPATNSAVR